ncbi:MAG: hypothetical protein WBD32_22170 [Acidobacteriaceae bacterium]
MDPHFCRIVREHRLERFTPVFAQIDPRRVHFVDEREFLSADPPFDLLFAIDSAIGIVEAFVPDESVAVVIGGEAGEVFGFVLDGARFDVAVMPVYRFRERLAMMYA